MKKQATEEYIQYNLMYIKFRDMQGIMIYLAQIQIYAMKLYRKTKEC